MMKHIIFAILLTASLPWWDCRGDAASANGYGDTLSGKKILIVYLSRTKNTEAVAMMIHQEVGGTLVQLALQHPYPEDYQSIVRQVQQENETGYLPPLKTTIEDFRKYDVVFIGFPTWGMRLPPPMKTFLTEYDLSGKTIIPFNTHAGYGTGTSIDTIHRLCPNSTILEAFSVQGGIERDRVLFVMRGRKEMQVREEVSRWLRKLGFL